MNSAVSPYLLRSSREVWLWPVIIMVSALAVILFSFVDLVSPLRVAVGLWFVLVCPGMALVRFLHIEDPVNELMLAVAVSIGLGATLATAMALTQNWLPNWGIVILVYISVVGAVLQLTTAGEFARSDSASTVRPVEARNRIRLYFGIMIVAFVLMAISGAVLSWDGGFHFFKGLDTQSPYIPHNRLITIPAHTITLFVSQFVDDIGVLQIVFGLVYSSVPLGSLALSWWIVRRKSPSLFIWPALGIAIATLPGQFALIVEATLAVQLFWPVILIVLTRVENRHAPILLLLPIVMIFTHPFSIPLLGMAVLLMFMVGIFDPRARLKMWIWTLIFALLGALAAFRFTQTIELYEAQRLSIAYLLSEFNRVVRGYWIVGLIVAWFVALVVAARPLVIRLGKWIITRIYTSWEFIGIATAGLLFIVWASNPQRWAATLDYRHWVAIFSLPFFGLATIESLQRRVQTPRDVQTEWNHRSQIVLSAGIICLLTLALQSVGWIQLTQRLETTIANNTNSCIPASSIEWLNRTPLNHFAVTAYSLVLQGRTPEKVVLLGDRCSSVDMTTGFPLAEDWEWRDWEGNWFDMSQLQAGILNEQGIANASE